MLEQDYIDQAQNTKSPVTEATEDQLKLFCPFSYALLGVTDGLDYVKKNIFYGKPIPDDIFDSVDKREQEYLSRQDVVEVDIDVLHGILGLATEAAELMEAMLKGELTKEKFMDEFGDLNWYGALLLKHFDTTFSETWERNNNKLRIRFPDKFEADRAINKDDAAEAEAFA